MFSFLSFLLFPFLGSLKSESYPDKLSNEEEEFYLKQYQAGDMQARSILIEHNLRLVAHIVKKYENTKEEKDDLLSIGMIGLIKAIDTYKFDHHNKLGTYAARCIENEILMTLRNNKKYRNISSLNQTIGSDKEGNKITLMDVVRDDSESIENQMIFQESLSKLKSSLHILDSRELEIIEKRYGLNGQKAMTQKEISKDMNISRSYVSRIEKRALMKLYFEIIDS